MKSNVYFSKNPTLQIQDFIESVGLPNQRDHDARDSLPFN
jgi:hypothetical protein